MNQKDILLLSVRERVCASVCCVMAHVTHLSFAEYEAHVCTLAPEYFIW